MPRTPSLPYLLQLPAGYERQPRRRWPLLLFLHASEERGTDRELLKKHGPLKLIVRGQQFPFMVLAPQCPANRSWNSRALLALVDAVCAHNRVDERRLYVTGISMGGYGTWALALAQPDRFAAIVPICGGGRPLLAKKIVHLPVWAFHGAKDDVVPLAESERMIHALKNAGAKHVKFTVYPEAGHDAWTETYENPAVFHWLLKQRKR